MPTYLVRARGFTEAELRLSALPFLLAAAGNFSGGVARDAAVRKWGLQRGPRAIGVVALGVAALCVVAALMADNKYAALVGLGLCYAAITFQQTTVWAVCIDIGRHHAGSVAGCMNTAANLGGFISSVLFGVMVQRFGGYNVPLITMAAILFAGAALWLGVNGAEALVPSQHDRALEMHSVTTSAAV